MGSEVAHVQARGVCGVGDGGEVVSGGIAGKLRWRGCKAVAESPPSDPCRRPELVGEHSV